MDSPTKVLIVDDDPRSLRLAQVVIESSRIACLAVNSAADALAALHARPEIDVLLSDIVMPAIGGLDLLAQVRREFASRPWLQLLLITGQASVESAVAAMRLDASDYLLKPVTPPELRQAVQQALDRARSIRSIVDGRGAGDEAGLREIAQAARDLAGLIGRLGESGRDAESAAEALRLLGRLEEARSSLFGQAVMPEPSWEMLAELMRAQLAGRQLSVTSLALASKCPNTTAMRRIDDLVRSGLVERIADQGDRRRTHLKLSPTGLMRMRMFLVRFSEIATVAR
jgi:CheY-like chemotaxis protein/DNA-binding MarR family transcriptional regulator